MRSRPWYSLMAVGGALVCFAVAGGLVIGAGLPSRAALIGQISTNGRLIAPAAGAFAPDFDLPALHGGTVRLSSLSGSPIILNFWATWCEPCRVEMPQLQALYDQYAASGLRVVAINLGESRADAQRWAETLGLTFDIVLDSQETLRSTYYLPGQPVTLVLTPEGIITRVFYGPVTRERLEQVLLPMLRPSAPPTTVPDGDLD